MLSVATWNVLAPAHVRAEYYGGVDPALLAEPGRRRRVGAMLADLLAAHDVVALQEVDADLVAAQRAAGRSVLARLRPGHPDGVALVSARHELVELGGGTTRDGRRVWLAGSVAGAVVVCAHLDWDAPDAVTHAGQVQAEELVAAVAGLDGGSGPVVLCADLNADWASRVGAVLAAAGFAAALTGVPTAAIGGRAVELDTVAVRAGVAEAAPVFAGAVPGVGQPLWLPDAQVPSDHVPVAARVRPGRPESGPVPPRPDRAR